jgi:hypothetical protein
MKTGKLFKFPRPGGDVHAYVYREGGVVKAALYVLSPERSGSSEPTQVFTGPNEADVERDLRAFVDARFPRQP